MINIDYVYAICGWLQMFSGQNLPSASAPISNPPLPFTPPSLPSASLIFLSLPAPSPLPPVEWVCLLRDMAEVRIHIYIHIYIYINIYTNIHTHINSAGLLVYARAFIPCTCTHTHHTCT